MQQDFATTNLTVDVFVTLSVLDADTGIRLDDIDSIFHLVVFSDRAT